MDPAATEHQHSAPSPTAHAVIVWTPDHARIGARVPLGARGLRAGRGARDPAWFSLPSEDRRASRDHFSLEWRAGRLAVRDSGSRNGTAVDGASVPTAGVVVPPDGALIRAGDTLLVLRSGEPSHGGELDSWMPGPSPSASGIRAVIDRLAASPAAPLLLVGEPGTGKQMAARRLHALSAVEGAPWVHVWCADAMRGRDAAAVLGRAAHARGGTLYLEDVAQLDVALQRALLGAIRWWSAEGGLRVVGSAHALPAGPSADGPLVRWLRASQILEVQALRARREDIPALAAALVARRSPRVLPPPLRRWDPDTVEALLLHGYARNLHDLGEVMVAAALNATGSQRLEPGHLPGSVLTSWQRARDATDQRFPWQLG